MPRGPGDVSTRSGSSAPRIRRADAADKPKAPTEVKRVVTVVVQRKEPVVVRVAVPIAVVVRTRRGAEIVVPVLPPGAHAAGPADGKGGERVDLHSLPPLPRDSKDSKTKPERTTDKPSRWQSSDAPDANDGYRQKEIPELAGFESLSPEEKRVGITLVDGQIASLTKKLQLAAPRLLTTLKNASPETVFDALKLYMVAAKALPPQLRAEIGQALLKSEHVRTAIAKLLSGRAELQADATPVSTRLESLRTHLADAVKPPLEVVETAGLQLELVATAEKVIVPERAEHKLLQNAETLIKAEWVLANMEKLARDSISQQEEARRRQKRKLEEDSEEELFESERLRIKRLTAKRNEAAILADALSWEEMWEALIRHRKQRRGR